MTDPSTKRWQYAVTIVERTEYKVVLVAPNGGLAATMLGDFVRSLRPSEDGSGPPQVYQSSIGAVEATPLGAGITDVTTRLITGDPAPVETPAIQPD